MRRMMFEVAIPDIAVCLRTTRKALMRAPRIAAVLFAVTAFSTSAQAQFRWKPLLPGSVATNAPCSLVLAVPQDVIATERQISASEISPSFGAGWLTRSIIDGAFTSSRNREIERNIVPIRAALERDDTQARFHQVLVKNRVALPCKADDEVIRIGPAGMQQAAAMSAHGSKMLWLVRIRYSMSGDSRYLTAHAMTALFPAEARESLVTGDQRVMRDLSLYQNQFTYTRKLEAVGSAAELASIWTADDATLLKSGLDEVAEGVIAPMIADIGLALRSEPSSPGHEFDVKVFSRSVTVRREADGSLVAITA